MKTIALSLGMILFMAVGVQAQQAAAATKVAAGATIEFEKEVHDFGTMKQHGDASTEFKFTNNGSEALIISNAKGSCGCTVPEWPREPIAPGASAVIRVKYDSKRIGPINKSVTITSNASNQPTKVIRIKGNIEPAPKEQTTPVKKTSGLTPTAG